MSKLYQCSIEVRGYELDSFGHVNHAVYVSYLEHARWKLLEEEGIGPAQFQSWQRWPVIARIEVDYLKPTFMGDRLEIQTRLTAGSRTSFVAEQAILRDGAVVSKANVHVVTVNEKGRPAEIPAEVARLWGPAGPSSEHP